MPLEESVAVAVRESGSCMKASWVYITELSMYGINLMVVAMMAHQKFS